MDWVKFLISAVVGLVSYSIHLSHLTILLVWYFVSIAAAYFFPQVAVVGSVDMPQADLWVIFAILSTVIGYCAKTYFT